MDTPEQPLPTGMGEVSRPCLDCGTTKPLGVVPPEPPNHARDSLSHRIIHSDACGGRGASRAIHISGDWSAGRLFIAATNCSYVVSCSAIRLHHPLGDDDDAR